jgi:hypothetical protein
MRRFNFDSNPIGSAGASVGSRSLRGMRGTAVSFFDGSCAVGSHLRHEEPKPVFIGSSLEDEEGCIAPTRRMRIRRLNAMSINVQLCMAYKIRPKK